jgi:nucleoid-associated protein YgaU
MFDALTAERVFGIVSAEQMYAAGYGIRPMSSSRRSLGARQAVRSLAVFVMVAVAGAALAVVVHGSAVNPDVTVVVRPGDTLWTIAAAHYPADDVRGRVVDIERANGLQNPVIAVGETLRLPA